MLGLTFSSKLDWDLYIISIAKTASKKIGAFICYMKFLSPEVALYLYKSTIRQCMEYCCHVRAGAPNCYFELLDKTLKPLAHGWNVTSLNLFYRYYFGRCSSELAQLVPLSFSRERSTHYSDRLHDFWSPFLDAKRMFVSTVSFLAQFGSGILCLYNGFLWPVI